MEWISKGPAWLGSGRGGYLQPQGLARSDDVFCNDLRSGAALLQGGRVWGLWFGVCSLWFGVCGLGFEVWGLGFGVRGLEFGIWLGFGVWG